MTHRIFELRILIFEKDDTKRKLNNNFMNY